MPRVFTGTEDIQIIDEVGMLIRQFNSMSERIKELVENNAQIEEKKRQMEISKYSKIMNYRYGGRMILEMEIEASLLRENIPKYILQPIIENSFMYALSEGTEQIVIRISGKTEEKIFLISVIDNGGGIEEDMLLNLRRRIEENEESGHIGLTNVYQRLKLLYNVGFEFNVESVKGEGFAVYLRLPYNSL